MHKPKDLQLRFEEDGWVYSNDLVLGVSLACFVQVYIDNDRDRIQSWFKSEYTKKTAEIIDSFDNNSLLVKPQEFYDKLRQIRKGLKRINYYEPTPTSY